MQYDFIGFRSQSISGVMNPFLRLEGSIKIKNYNFILEVDGANKEFNLTGLPGEGNFILTSNLDRKDRNIKLYLVTKKDKLLVYEIKNTMFKRVKSKISGKVKNFLSLIRAILITLFKGIKFMWREYHFLVPPKLWKKYLNDFIERVKFRGVKLFYEPFKIDEYHKFLNEYEQKSEIKNLNYNPLFSILIPVYNINKKYLSECIDSIINQTYDNFEICLVDDCSTNKETINTLKEYEKKDKRVKVKYRKENGHISKATNDALKIAKGEFIVLVDNDDVLSKNALYEVALVLNDNKNIDFIYSDEDKLNLNGKRCDPHYKPDYSPDTLLSLNYICHLSVLRKSIVDDIGGFTVGLEGAQDHDLFLRFTEKTNKIYHIPKILYHWRMVEGSTSMALDNKSYANDKGKMAIENALKRRKIKGHVEKDDKSTYYRVVYDFNNEPLVSIIIPTKDYAETLNVCLKSLYSITDYKNYEVIVVNNNSEEQETFKLFDHYQKKYKNFKILNANYEFNYSKINNDAVKKAKGEYIVLLNNDTEIIQKDWLKIMIGYASQKHIGAVGPKLLYPDETVQHAGVILGLGGVASHAYIGSLRDELGMYGRLRVPYNYAGVTAACLAVSKKKYEEVNGLEEDLKVAYNDVDFNIKLLKKGYYNICVPQIEMFHFESKSRGLDTTTEKYQRFKKEEEYMFSKWKKEIENDKFYNPNFSKKIWFKLKK